MASLLCHGTMMYSALAPRVEYRKLPPGMSKVLIASFAPVPAGLILAKPPWIPNSVVQELCAAAAVALSAAKAAIVTSFRTSSSQVGGMQRPPESRGPLGRHCVESRLLQRHHRAERQPQRIGRPDAQVGVLAALQVVDLEAAADRTRQVEAIAPCDQQACETGRRAAAAHVVQHAARGGVPIALYGIVET